MRTLRIVFGLLLVAMPAVSVGEAKAAQVTLTAVQDNSIYSNNTSNSFGQGLAFFVGRNNQGFLRRGLVGFDVAASVPAGATIDQVTLTLHLENASGGGPSSRPVGLHRLLADWGEGASGTGLAGASNGNGVAAATGDATWQYSMFNTTTWVTAGGDFAATASATTTVPITNPQTTAFAWSSPAMIADVQGWLDNPATDFGWLVRGDEGNNGTQLRFRSREEAEGLRPALTIDYTPVPEPASAALLAAACVLAGSFCRRRTWGPANGAALRR